MNRGQLKALLKQAGIRPRRTSGQNFLVEEKLAEAIARDGEVEPEDVVLEVGTGFGVLTEHLCRFGAKVISVEKDRKLQVVARELLAEFTNLTIYDGDVLATKNSLNPGLLELLAQELAGGRRLRVVANLPYNIATPLVVLLLAADLPLDGIAVMVQLEAAERFAARQGDEKFGAVSLLCEALCERVEIVRRVPRDVFVPRPKVTSAVVRMTPRPGRRAGFPTFSALVRGLFNYRRKTLGKAAKLAAKQDPALGWVSAAILSSGFDPELRLEDLALADFQQLAAAGPGDLAEGAQPGSSPEQEPAPLEGAP